MKTPESSNPPSFDVTHGTPAWGQVEDPGLALGFSVVFRLLVRRVKDETVYCCRLHDWLYALDLIRIAKPSCSKL